MVRLLLVRHAQPTAAWPEHPDPGLSPVGARQAEELALRIGNDGPRAIVSSPLARARETAGPLARRLDSTPRLEPRVGEIPTGVTPDDDRVGWLRDLFTKRWDDADEAGRRWRADVIGALRALADDTVVVTHYVAINVAVGAATGDDRVRCCSPGHCSVTELTVDRGQLRLMSLGVEASTQVS